MGELDVPIDDINFNVLSGKISTVLKHKYLDAYENKGNIEKESYTDF